jgi:hypothetical protein
MESLVSDIPVRDGKIAYHFLQCSYKKRRQIGFLSKCYVYLCRFEGMGGGGGGVLQNIAVF